MKLIKLKQNPKKLKKMSTSELMDLFHLANDEIHSLSEQIEGAQDSQAVEKIENEINSWEKFLDEIEFVLDSRE